MRTGASCLFTRRSFAGCSALAATASRHLHAAPTRSKLCLWIVAEQFRADYFNRAAGLLPPDGFRRLIEEGTYFPDCRFLASTFTSSGLATLSSGAYPEAHGVVADSWYDRATQKVANASLKNTEATLLADEFSAAHHRNRVAAVGLDREHTWLLAGRTARYVFSMDAEGRFASQSGGAAEPAWVSAFNQANPAAQFKNTKWRAWGAKPDAPALRVLSDDSGTPEEFFTLYKSSPFAQATQFEFLRRMIAEEKLGAGEGTDLVIAVLGSAALLGYDVGADSPLMREMVISLDRQIQATLEMLTRTPGAGNYSVIFTAAHGSPPKMESRLSIKGETVAQAIDRALSDQFDGAGVKNRYVERYMYPFLYLRHEQLRRAKVNPREARSLAGQAALRVPGVSAYYTADGECSRAGSWVARFRNSFHAIRSGDLMLAYNPNYVEDYGTGRGVSYGSLYNYDASVPLILFGPHFAADEFESPVEAVDIAPTLARALGSALPSSATGRSLDEAFTANKPNRG